MNAYEDAANFLAADSDEDDDRLVGSTIGDLKELVSEITMLRESLTQIVEHTDPDSPKENYRADDREGCLDTVFAIARKALSREVRS